MSHELYFFRHGFFVYYNKSCYEQQRGKKTLLSLTLICYCHLVGMAKIVRGSTFVRPWNTATWRFGWLTVLAWHCLDLYYKLTCTLLFWSLDANGCWRLLFPLFFSETLETFLVSCALGFGLCARLLVNVVSLVSQFGLYLSSFALACSGV